MLSSRHRIASSSSLARLRQLFGGRLLLRFLSILCLLVFIGIQPAQAQVSNVRVDPYTAVVSWTLGDTSGTLRFAIEINRVNGQIPQNPTANSQNITDLTTTSFSLSVFPACCTIGDTYGIVFQSTNTNQTPGFLIQRTFTYGVGPPAARSARRPTRKPTPTPGPIPTQDHSQLPAGAEVISDSIWISMREVSGAAIGDPLVRAAAQSAIDIWAPLGLQAEVCFAQGGSLLLLDAAYSPRRLVWMDSYQRADGKTCARLDRNGTVVLMPNQPAAAATPAPQATATPNPYMIADSLDDMVALENCMVSANYVLNFRESPAGRFISLYLGASEAIARTENWFKVRYLGEEGWISAHFVTTEGDCG